jgi:hypothetical protein
MTTEKTISKDSKSNGGIVGLTRKKSNLPWSVIQLLRGDWACIKGI